MQVAEEEKPAQAARSLTTRIRMLMAIWSAPLRREVIQKHVEDLRQEDSEKK
jgi:hypothetical protein